VPGAASLAGGLLLGEQHRSVHAAGLADRAQVGVGGAGALDHVDLGIRAGEGGFETGGVQRFAHDRRA